MLELLDEDRFHFITAADKEFICSYNEVLNKRGYGFDGKIGSGYCWGKYMIIYRKMGVKSESVYARIYIRESNIVLRMFFNQIDQHRSYIERAPQFIKEVFTGPHGKCEHCHNEKDGKCKFRKTYTIDGLLIEKCNGIVFEFHEPNNSKLNVYIDLFSEFYPGNKR